MGFTVEQECPQCGAPIELEETDLLLLCPYCNVKSYLFTPDYFRFVLPHKAPNRDLIYVPYLRFKGNVYFCNDSSLRHRIIDITHSGSPLKGIPASLGLRPQAMKLKFMTPDITGEFLKFTLETSKILDRACRLSSPKSAGQILHRAYIGEVLSLIYLPIFVAEDTLFDAVLNRPITRLRDGKESIDPKAEKNPQWQVKYLATLCPQCGWNLEGERDSVVLICTNCETAWEASKGGFVKIGLETSPGNGGNNVHLPFWKISATSKGVEINSFADFIRVTNQPRVIQEQWKHQTMSFWSPAFKIRPKVFLNLSRQFTISQKQFQTEDKIPENNFHPVTLSRSEAAQALKLTLAGSTLNKKSVFPHLPQIKFHIKNSTLVFLPFRDTGNEMIQQDLGISININTLAFGRYL